MCEYMWNWKDVVESRVEYINWFSTNTHIYFGNRSWLFHDEKNLQNSYKPIPIFTSLDSTIERSCIKYRKWKCRHWVLIFKCVRFHINVLEYMTLFKVASAKRTNWLFNKIRIITLYHSWYENKSTLKSVKHNFFLFTHCVIDSEKYVELLSMIYYFTRNNWNYHHKMWTEEKINIFHSKFNQCE